MGTSSEKITVRDIKNEFEARFNAAHLTEAQRAFAAELHRLGARNILSHPPENHPDIDATVELNPEEVLRLRERMKAL